MDWPVFTFQQIVSAVRSELETSKTCVVDQGVCVAVGSRSGCVEVLWHKTHVTVYRNRYVVDGCAFGNPEEDAQRIRVITTGHTPLTTLAGMLSEHATEITNPAGVHTSVDDGDFDDV